MRNEEIKDAEIVEPTPSVPPAPSVQAPAPSETPVPAPEGEVKLGGNGEPAVASDGQPT